LTPARQRHCNLVIILTSPAFFDNMRPFHRGTSATLDRAPTTAEDFASLGPGKLFGFRVERSNSVMNVRNLCFLL
jgi:hypothetical protein